MIRRAHLDIDANLLRMVLDLPAGMQVVGVVGEEPLIHNVVRLVVEGDDCPEAFDGLPLPRVILHYESVNTMQARVDRIDVWQPETVPTHSEGDE